MASAAATTPQPGCVWDAEWESSVSSACASMPFASAAFAAAVTIRLPTTQASLAPPRVLVNAIAFFPGGSREPESIAARVSSRWCLVFSETAGGSGLRKAPAMYALKRCMTGEGAECMFFLGAVLRHCKRWASRRRFLGIMSGEEEPMKRVAAALFVALAFSGGAGAQGWPEKPVRFIGGFTPGGPTHNLERALGQERVQPRGQQVVIENRRGHGG